MDFEDFILKFMIVVLSIILLFASIAAIIGIIFVLYLADPLLLLLFVLIIATIGAYFLIRHLLAKHRGR